MVSPEPGKYDCNKKIVWGMAVKSVQATHSLITDMQYSVLTTTLRMRCLTSYAN